MRSVTIGIFHDEWTSYHLPPPSSPPPPPLEAILAFIKNFNVTENEHENIIHRQFLLFALDEKLKNYERAKWETNPKFEHIKIFETYEMAFKCKNERINRNG